MEIWVDKCIRSIHTQYFADFVIVAVLAMAKSDYAPIHRYRENQPTGITSGTQVGFG